MYPTLMSKCDKTETVKSWTTASCTVWKYVKVQPMKNYFDNQNFEIFDKVVHKFGKFDYMIT